MATKTLNTRIKVRYDTLENWRTKNPFLLQGEVAVVEIPGDTHAGVVISEPAFLVKVGGSNKETINGAEFTGSRFNDTPYITCQAGDVHEWAKASSKPDYKSTEIIVETTSALGQALELESNSTLDAVISDLKASLETDTNTQYDLQIGDGTNGGNPGQIRFGYKDATVQNSTFTYGNWVTVGVAVVAGNGITVSTTNGTSTVSAKLSGKTDNLLSIENDDNSTENINEAGLYVPKATVTAYTPTAQTNDGTVDVLTGIATSDGHTFTQNIENIYTKTKIDALINPGMEFKGVKTAAQLDDITLTSTMLGDSYKISSAGDDTLTNTNLQTVKAGDLAIVIEGSTTGTYEWAIIPAGDDVEDTWRTISVNGTEALSNGTGSGGVDFVDGTGIDITANNGTITVAANTSELVTALKLGTVPNDKTLQGQIDTLNSTHVDSETGKYDTVGSVAKVAQDAADAAVAALDETITAGTDSNNKKKVFTTIAEVDGKLNAAASVATVLGIEDIDMGDYLILDGGNASSFSS